MPTTTTTTISRRKLLHFGGAGAALATVGSVAYLPTAQASLSLLPKWQQEVPRLPVRTGPQTIVMAQSTHQFHPWLPPTSTWAYGGMTYGGPVIEARAGTPQTITFSNQLGRHILAANITSRVHGTRDTDAARPRSTVHLHGAIVKAQFDGHPEDTYFPGQSKTYIYPNNQEACHLWYHDHSLGMTRLNVYAGLAGQYLLRDNWDSGEANILGLPSGDCEIPLMLQDKAVDNFTGKLNYMPAILPQASWFPGFFGDISLVNGAAFPKLTVARGVYRLRLLNAANSRFYTLSLSNGAYFHVIGNDQGMLNKPESTKSLNFGPGERYDVLVDFTQVSPGTTVTVYNSSIPPNAGWVFGNFTEVMRFDVTSATGRFTQLPKTLRGGINQRPALPAVGSLTPVRVRNITIVQAVDPLCGGLVPIVMRLNNMNYDQGQPEVVQAGQWEQWNIINTTVDEHPFHVHMAELRIKGRQSLNTALYQLLKPAPFFPAYWAPSADNFVTSTLQPPAAWESGRKDTVVVAPFGVTRIMVRMPTPAESGVDPTTSFVNAEGQTLSGYMYHCHMLEHEDCDMMRPMQITV